MRSRIPDSCLEAMVSEGLYSNRRRLKFHLESLFDGVDLQGKTVLDIGGGQGLHSFSAAYAGASKVICLEPEAEGSASGAGTEGAEIGKRLGCTSVEFRSTTIQELRPDDVPLFDVVLLHNSVNHLDEGACERLQSDWRARETYQSIFRKIGTLSKLGSTLIVCDCSRLNVFPLLGLRNPFVPTIEWNKHQQPKLWARLLADAGYARPRVRWSSFNALGGWGRVLTGNRAAAFFSTSHFCLMMEKAECHALREVYSQPGTV